MAASFGLAAQAPPVIETYHLKLPQQPLPTNSATSLSVSESKRHQKFKLDPIKIAEPSQKKLNIPESQRIMYILDELIRKFEIIDYIPLIINNEERIKNLIKPHLNEEEKKNKFEQVFLHMCKHHKDLVNKYNRGEYKSEEKKTGGIDIRYESDNHSERSNQSKHQLELFIKSSCKDILRVFHSKPAFFESIKTEFSQGKPANPQVEEILSLFKEVKDMMNERLLTTPNEQKEKLDYLKELLLREKTNNELIKRLRDEYSQALTNKEKEIQSRNDQIRKLDHDIKQVERFNIDIVKRTKTEAEQQEASEIKASDGRKTKLQTELNQLRTQFQTLMMDHRDQEQQLRKEKWKHETNVEGLVSRYDEDMGKKQEEYDEIEKLYEEEKKQLSELEEKFKPLEEEYLKIMEDRRIAERMRQMEEESLNRKVKAALLIQSYWRGYKLRKGLFKKKGKKGKGKGKGKK